jgi:type II secretory pathway component GspD/PulD (secretin)
MDADFQEMTLVQVANQIYFSTNIPVSVDPEVAQELDDAGETVNLSGLRDLPVESVLNILVEQVGEDLAWTVRNGRVYITKKDKAAGNPIVRVHNIQDLTFPITDFKGADIRDIPLPGEAGDDPETTVFASELDRVRLISPDEVLNLVRENIARESWDASEAYSIDFVDSQNLLVIHTPEVQAQVADFLDDLRAFSTSMVTLEARFFALTDAFIEEISTDLRGLGPDGQLGNQVELDDVDPINSQGLDNNGDGTGNPNAGVVDIGDDSAYAATTEFFFDNPLGKLLSTTGGGAFQFTFLNDTQVNVVMTAIEKSVNAFEISSPIVSVYNTQRAFVTVVNQVSFVQGFDVDVANAAFIADPNIGVVQEGIVLDVRPTISFDRKYVTLDVQATVANLVRPIREISTNLGGNTDQVTFSLPQLDVQDAQTTVVVPDGGSVMLGGFKHVLYRNRTAEAPFLADIPIVGFFFREKGLADEMTDLIIVMRATITDYSELEEVGSER